MFSCSQLRYECEAWPVKSKIFPLLETDGFAFDVEILLLARELDVIIEERPIMWVNSADSKVHMVKDSFRMLVEIASIRRKISAQVARSHSKLQSKFGEDGL